MNTLLQLAIDLAGLSHRYGDRLALNALTLTIRRGEIFAVVGKNGSGKTTLFRVLSTLVPIQQGSVQILGWQLPQHLRTVRQRIGVVFQAPSLDRKLTVAENIRFQAALYGLSRRQTAERQTELMEQLGLTARAGERTETLSGGLRRRAELAKGLIHGPELLLLDEPSTGLDPAVRGDLWEYLQRLRAHRAVTVIMTTHLLDEAERADRIAILDQGRLVALDSPAALKASVGGDAITIRCRDAAGLQQAIASRFQIPAAVVDGQVRMEQAAGAAWVGRLLEAFGTEIETITLGRPSLEDVFIDKTGHRFWSGGDA